MTLSGLVLPTPHSWEMPLEEEFPSSPCMVKGVMGLLQGCCQLAPTAAAKGPVTTGSPSLGWLVGGAPAQHHCHPLSLLLTSALFALGQAVLPISQCSRWPRWLWKLSKHCQGDTLAIEPSPPHQPPAHPHTASKVLWAPWASLLH